ncbi:MAG TPA: heme-binding protein [Casimicrobiaceae bacterium]|nr:heme-binding protein [Casimicrobiaceae bacterium]
MATKGEAHLNTGRFLAAFALFGLVAPAFAQVGTFETKSITPETALIAAKAAMETCRKQGYQVAVAVVDRSGLTQVLLRDRFAGPHTVELATNKAWTAASFRTSTLVLAADTQPGKPMSGLRGIARVVTVGGGILIEGGGSIFGAIGVSGAPGGEADDACAQSGVKAIGDAIEF